MKENRRDNQSKHTKLNLINLLQIAGYTHPTRLQELVVPAILERRDVIVEGGVHPGKTLTITCGLILRGLSRTGSPSVLILTLDRNLAHKLQRAFSGHLASFLDGLSFCINGFSDLIKKEARQLGEKPDILITTPSRLIDHLRRNNLDLANLELIFIDEQEIADSAFENDLCYILTKTPSSVQIVRFTFEGENRYPNLTQLIKKPLLIKAKDFCLPSGSISFSYLVDEALDKLLLSLLAATDFSQALVVTESFLIAKQLISLLAKSQLSYKLLTSGAEHSRLSPLGENDPSEGPKVFLISVSNFSKISLQNISHLIIYGEQATISSLSTLTNQLSNIQNSLVCYFLIEPQSESKLLLSLKETNLKLNKGTLPNLTSILLGLLRKLFSRSRALASDPNLKQMLKQVPKAIPFGYRSYFISFLLYNNLRSLFTKSKNFVTLFLNIGQQKKLTEKELLQLFIRQLKITPTSLGKIRLFTNYSFIEIEKEYAELAIKKLTNYEFKGQRLIVNYSRHQAENRQIGNHHRQ